jgi:hypothetical protein
VTRYEPDHWQSRGFAQKKLFSFDFWEIKKAEMLEISAFFMPFIKI